MQRRKKCLCINLSSFIFDKVEPFYKEIYSGIKIIDDIKEENIDFGNVLNYLNKYEVTNVYLNSFTKEHHKKIIENINSNDINVFLESGEVSFSEVFSYFNPEKENFNDFITEENITRIYNKDRYKLDLSSVKINHVRCYYDEFLSNVDFLRVLDIIAFEISKYAKTDVEKVVLVNKIIKENLLYDFECLEETRKHKLDNNYIQKDSFEAKHENLHIGHIVQSIFTRKNVVCSGIAPFASILLNHPLVNVKTKSVINDRVIKDHTWNNVKIGNKWYTCDFTWTIMYNDLDILKYILIKSRCKNDDDYIDSCIYSENDYDRLELNRALEKFKDVHITIPKVPMTGKKLIQNSKTVSTRRTSEEIEEIVSKNQTQKRRIGVSISENPKVRRKGIIRRV